MRRDGHECATRASGVGRYAATERPEERRHGDLATSRTRPVTPGFISITQTEERSLFLSFPSPLFLSSLFLPLFLPPPLSFSRTSTTYLLVAVISRRGAQEANECEVAGVLSAIIERRARDGSLRKFTGASAGAAVYLESSIFQ